MAQTNPTYSAATGKAEKPIIDELIRKYGSSNVIWPIVLSKDDRTIAYFYEKNYRNSLNQETDNRPKSRTNISSYDLDYTKSLRGSIPPNAFFAPFLDSKYSCSYEYVVDSPFSTVDLDYVWYDGVKFKGFEFTTFWMEFTSQNRALELLSKMNRRPSWQGPDGAHALRKVVDSAADLGVAYYLVGANTVSKVGSDLKTDGNVCLFELTHRQVDRIESGKPPEESVFMTFHDFLKWL